MKRSEFYLTGRDAATKLLLFLGMAALLGMNIAFADIKNESSQTPITFSISTGENSVNMPDVSFDSAGCDCEEAQTTCAMTPGGTATDILLEEPVVPQLKPLENYDYSPQRTLAPINSLNSPPPSNTDGRGFPRTPPSVPTKPGTHEELETPPTTPEPATLLIMGLGLAGLGWARRMRK